MPKPLACQRLFHRMYSEKPPGPAQTSPKYRSSPSRSFVRDFCKAGKDLPHYLLIRHINCSIQQRHQGWATGDLWATTSLQVTSYGLLMRPRPQFVFFSLLLKQQLKQPLDSTSCIECFWDNFFAEFHSKTWDYFFRDAVCHQGFWHKSPLYHVVQS